MIVVINSDDSALSDNRLPLQKDVLLHFLIGLGYDPANPPLADLLRRYHRLEGDWLILSPMHWEASHKDAQISFAAQDFQWTPKQAKTWYQLFADFLAEGGMNLQYHSPEIWLLRIDKKPPINAKPIHQIMNKPFMQELQALDKQMYWQKFLTESQMFFASRPNDTPLNGVWLWGGARLKKQKLAVCADKSFFKLAQNCQAKVTEYEPNLSLKQYELLLLKNLDSLSLEHQKELKNMSLTWYWNNTAYTTKTNYLLRLWRNLIHAH